MTQFLKLKAEAGSDELLIVAQSIPVSLSVDGWVTEARATSAVIVWR